MKKICRLKIEKPVILTVIRSNKKTDEKVYITCEYSFMSNQDLNELEKRISHTISLEIMLSCSLKYADGILFEDILKGNIDIHDDMMERLKWSYADECEIIDFHVIEAHFEKDKIDSTQKWLCICGAANDSNFCPFCGRKKSFERWICECGSVNVGKYCTQCGKKKQA